MTPPPSPPRYPIRKNMPLPRETEKSVRGAGDFFHGIRGKKFPFPIDKTVSTVYTVNIQF